MTASAKPNANHASLLWAGPEVAPEIADMHARLFPEPWHSAGVSKLLEHPGATTLIAKTGFPKASVGFVMGQLAADEAEVLSIGVVPEWQRAGLGKRLMEGLERALKKAGTKRMFLEVAEDNKSARALYDRCGFKEVGRRKGYYARNNSPAVDALVLSKVL